MLNCLFADSAFPGISHGRVSGAFKASANREGQFYKTASLLIERPRPMAGLSEIVEGLPNFWMALSKVVNRLR